MPHNPPPPRRRNLERRTHEFLTEDEVERLLAAVKKSTGRHKERDALMITLMYRHGLRVSELCSLKWTQFNLEERLFYVQRAKRGKPSTHPLSAKEVRALEQQRKRAAGFEHVFISERLAPLTPATVRKMIAVLGREAGLGPAVHPHMLRHATGYKLANDGRDLRTIQDFMGHRNINHTVRYTELAADRFKGLFKDG
jgi:type 1 fimbriae regulatory protein FimB/type 1 fimbriae regulatory protein FimE